MIALTFFSALLIIAALAVLFTTFRVEADSRRQDSEPVMIPVECRRSPMKR